MFYCGQVMQNKDSFLYFYPSLKHFHPNTASAQKHNIEQQDASSSPHLPTEPFDAAVPFFCEEADVMKWRRLSGTIIRDSSYVVDLEPFETCLEPPSPSASSASSSSSSSPSPSKKNN